MIAVANEAQRSQEIVGFFVMAGVFSGAFILIYLVVRQLMGKPLLPANPRPFRSVDPAGLIMVGLGVYVAEMAAGLLLRGGGLWGVVGILFGLNIGVLAYHFAVRKAMRPVGRARWRVAQGLLVVWAALPVIYGFFFLIGWLGGFAEQDAVRYLRRGRGGWQQLAVFAVLVAPWLEEIAFRGLLYPAMRRAWGVKPAVIVTSVLFGLIHVQPNVVMPLAVFGVFLAYLVETTGSVLPCVIAHAAFNGLTVLSAI